MAMQPEIRYINSYVSGNVALQPEKMPQNRTSARLPKARKPQRWVIPVDMVALGGLCAAAVLCVMLIVGLVEMNQAQQEAKMYKDYAMSLQQSNAALENTCTSGYDLKEVEQIALAIGMVPQEEVTHLQMQVAAPQEVRETTAWENFWAFLVGMFA